MVTTPQIRSLASVVLVAALAGCASAEPAASGEPIPSSAPLAGFDDTTGGIAGLVLDEESAPLGKAALQLVPGGWNATTALDGSFSFSQIPPGKYNLLVARLGYNSKGMPVDVLVGQVTSVKVFLDAIAVTQPRSEIFGPFQGHMECRMSLNGFITGSSGPCGFVPVVGSTPVSDLWTNDKVLWNFGKFTSEDFTAIVFEARWTPSSAATNPNMMQVFSYDGRPGTHWWADSGSSGSPINMVWIRGEDGPGGQLPGDTPDENKEPTTDHLLRTWITIPFASVPPLEVAYQLRFEMMVTIYYSQLPPEAYSAFPDG